MKIYVASSWRNNLQAVGAGKRTAILLSPDKMVDLVAVELHEIVSWLEVLEERPEK